MIKTIRGACTISKIPRVLDLSRISIEPGVWYPSTIDIGPIVWDLYTISIRPRVRSPCTTSDLQLMSHEVVLSWATETCKYFYKLGTN